MKYQSSMKLLNTAVRLFSSFGFATGLILFVAVMSMLGTILPSSRPEQIPGIQPQWSIRSIISFFRFDDMFHSPLFLFLGFLLFVNIAVCTGKKFHRLAFRTRKTHQEKFSDSISRAKHVPVILRSLIHVGIIIIIGGFTLGGYAGFESYVEIPEGKSVPIASVVPGNKRVDRNLEIRCDDFTIEYYESGMPKEFRSDLTFTKDDKILHQGPLMVNHPISVDGIRYYQAHYRAYPLAVVTVGYKGQNHSFSAVPGESIRLGRGTFAYVSCIEENFMNMGPAVKIDFLSPGEKGSLWIFYRIDEILESVPDFFSRAPQFKPSKFDGYVFSLTDLKPLYATGLMVAYDPGIPIVAFGSILLLVGLFFTYLAPSSRFRFRLKENAVGEKTDA